MVVIVLKGSLNNNLQNITELILNAANKVEKKT